jgi:nucleoside-diphosphate-sugar epimerase
MTETNEIHVVIGAGGGTGSAVVRELVAREKQVRAINRSGRAVVPPEVEVLKGDAADADRMREVCRGAGVVYNCVNPPFTRWTQMFPPIMEAVIEAAAASGARLVFADDTWMYGRFDGPMTEDLPYRPVSNKGVLRAWMAEMLLAAHCRGEVRATIGRAPALYGPAVRSVLGGNLFEPALKGKKIRWIGDLDVPITPMFVEDFARGLVVLGEREEALSEVWHIPTAEPITGREFTRMIFQEIGMPMKVGAYGSVVVRALGLFRPLAREIAEVVYQYERPLILAEVDLLEKTGALQRTVLDEDEVGYPEPPRKPEPPAHRLFPRTEAGTSTPQSFHVIGVSGVEPREGHDLPGHPLFRLSVLHLHDLRDRWQDVRVPSTNRLENLQ